MQQNKQLTLSNRESRRLRRAKARGVPPVEIKARALQSAAARAPRVMKPQGGRRAGRAASERWKLGLNEFSLGPLEFGGLKIDSRSETVGVAPRSTNIQTVMPRMRTTHDPTGAIDILEGTEIIEPVSAPVAGANAGDILARILINPNAFRKTRLAQFAPLYQRYRFRKLRFHYEPIANATQSGQLIGFGDYDVDNLLDTDTPDNVQLAAAHYSEGISQIWEPRVFEFGVDSVRDGFTSLYTSLTQAEARLIYQGVFYLIAASDLFLSAEGKTPLGNIYISYEIEFSIPQLALAELERFELKAACGFGKLGDMPPAAGGPLLATFAQQPVAGYSSNVDFDFDPGVEAGMSSFTFNSIPLGDYDVLLNGFSPGGFTQPVNIAATGGAAHIDFKVNCTGGTTIWNNMFECHINTTGDTTTVSWGGYAKVSVTSLPFTLLFSYASNSIDIASTTADYSFLFMTSGTAVTSRPRARHVAPLLMDHGRFIATEGERTVDNAHLTALSARLAALERLSRPLDEEEKKKSRDPPRVFRGS